MTQKRRKLITQAQIAELQGVSVEAVRQWRKAGCPFIQRDRSVLFDPGKVDCWRAQRAAANERGQLAEAKLRKEIAKADLAWLEVKRMRESLVPTSYIPQIHEMLVDAANARLMPLGGEIAPRIVGMQSLGAIKQVIDECVWNALNDLAHGYRADGKTRQH